MDEQIRKRADIQDDPEGWAAFKDGERARWSRVKASSKPCTSTWVPTITEQERQERDQQIQAGTIPF